MIAFTVPGDPRPLLRARSRRGGGKPYDPEENRIAKDGVIYAFRAVHTGPPESRPVRVSLTFRFARPLDHHVARDRSRPVKPNTPRWHAQKPDVDNLIKLVLDALTGVAWDDDVQVAWVTARKSWDSVDGTDVSIAVL